MSNPSEQSSRDALIEKTSAAYTKSEVELDDAFEVRDCRMNALYEACGGGGYPHSDCKLCGVSHSVQGLRTLLME